jgi:hypothetical protein
VNNEHDTNMAMLKLLVAWAGTFIGGVSLSGLVLGATLIFTLLQIFVIVRKIWQGQA